MESSKTLTTTKKSIIIPQVLKFLECVVCMEQFDLEERRPLVLPCGHSVCKACCIKLLENKEITCPIDR